MDSKAERINDLRERVFAKIDPGIEQSDKDLMNVIQETICEYAVSNPISVSDRMVLQKTLFNSMRKLDILSELLEDDEITEILINGPENIFVEKNGCLFETEYKFYSGEKLCDVIQQIVSANNQIVNESRPIADTRLFDGSRVNIVLPPVAVDDAIVSIRRFPKKPLDFDRMIETKTLSPTMAEDLKEMVRAGVNIFISGGTGSGKTTFLNALTQFIPANERVVTIEDSAELQVIGVKNLVRLEARPANLEGDLEVSIRDLVKASLRMRPDRIIVGECRGAEAIEMLQACNTGHDGSLSTGHANSTEDMISRLETMVLQGMEIPVAAIRKQIASALDVFIHLGRLPDGRRRVLEISVVDGIESGEVKLEKLYEYNYGSGKEEGWIRYQNMSRLQKLERLK